MSRSINETPDRTACSEAAAFLIAEYEGLLESFWRTEELGEKRVEFFITLVTALLGAIVLLDGVPAVGLEMIGALSALLALGVVVYQRILRRNLKSHQYLRAMGRIRRFFHERSSDSLSRYMFHAPCDSQPTRIGRFDKIAKKHGALWVLHWGTGGLLETVSLVNSLLGAGLLGLTVRYLLNVLTPELGSGLSNGSVFLTAFLVALLFWIAQRLLAKHAYHEAEDAILEETGDVRFPCSERD